MDAATNHDGSLLLGAGIQTAQGLCTVCSRPLPIEQTYWITRYPHGEHLHCRPWRTLPFPFERRLDVLRRIWRGTPAARQHVGAVGTALREMALAWPHKASADVVEQMLGELRVLRNTLAPLDVDRRLLNQL
jgi:hypothetical protein